MSIFELKLQLLGVELPSGADFKTLSEQPRAIEAMLGDVYEGRTWPEKGLTMIGYQRLTQLERCIYRILGHGIPGDFVETGVWRGGACIFMRHMLKIHGINSRRVWAMDSFEGLPRPVHERDTADILYTYPELAVSEEQVRKNFDKFGLLDDQVVFVKGWLKDTLPVVAVDPISILRLDSDMYDSTMDTLVHLYPRLSVGGYCIVDDYGATPAARGAVEDYREEHRIRESIEWIDWTGIYWIKK